jgi:hypothetical protein
MLNKKFIFNLFQKFVKSNNFEINGGIFLPNKITTI